MARSFWRKTDTSWHITLLAIGATPMLVTPALAQSSDACVGLLRHGIYDTFRQNTTAASASQAANQFCSAYQQYEHDKESGSVQASYSVFSGGASFNKDQMEYLGQAMCTSSFSASQADSSLSTFSSSIDAGAVAAYRDCVTRTLDGLQSDTQFDEDSGTGFSLTVYYVQPLGTSKPAVKFAGITKNRDTDVTCTGNLAQLHIGDDFKSSFAYQLDCRRVISPSPFNYQNRPIWALPLIVTVGTSAGSVVRSVDALPAGPPPTTLNLPIGAVIAFSGTIDEAVAQQAFGWWVADGRFVTDPVAATFFNKRTPDLTSKFLLGSASSGDIGVSQTATVPAQTIDSHTTGGFGAPSVNSDPSTHVQGNNSWTTERSIYSQGTFASTNISIPLPPYYTVIYLIKVK